mmetsp:Transcript_15524/g.24828  ORF Transcript_15524/g.24828 Transcript_15524/m.24828 type:complete len:85 (-) Transcript_15524:329-583(-)
MKVDRRAASEDISSQATNIIPRSRDARPAANAAKTFLLSSCMPSTALSTDPSGPRRAKFVAKTLRNVEPATQYKFVTKLVITHA